MKRIDFNVPNKMHDDITHFCETHDLSVAEYLRGLVQRHLNPDLYAPKTSKLVEDSVAEGQEAVEREFEYLEKVRKENK